jgi:nitrogen fixation protein NifX
MALIRSLRIVETASVPMEAALTVAFCSDDMKVVNQHFGSAKTFVIYAVDRQHSELLEVAEFGAPKEEGNNEDRLANKIAQLEGCAAIYCEAVGASAIRQLMAAGIQPVKVNRDSQISELLEDFQNELRTGPAAWVANALARQGQSDPEKFARLEADGWEE